MKLGLRGLLVLGLVLGVFASAVPRAAGDALDDLLFDLQLVPLDGRPPPPLSLEALNGGTVTLAGLKGRPVLVYFWASW